MQGKNVYSFNGDLGKVDWKTHACLCIEADKSGRWFAISPANYDENAQEQISNSVLEGSSVEELISVIEAMIGGNWPKNVSGLLDSCSLSPPNTKILARRDSRGNKRFFREISLFTIENCLSGDVEARTVIYEAYRSQKNYEGRFVHVDQPKW